jgi:hypothetical protein
MRTAKRIAVPVLLLALIVACANTAPDAVAYKSIGAVGVTANTAAKGWGDYVRAKGRCVTQPNTTAIPPTLGDPPGCVALKLETKVAAAWDTYQKALDVAEKAVAAWKALAVSNPNADPAIFNTAVQAVADAASALAGVVLELTGGK